MIKLTPILFAGTFVLFSCNSNSSGSESSAAPKDTVAKVAEVAPKARKYYIDVHDLEPGKVKFADVAGAHAKDLATQGKYDVNFIKYWVDEDKGKVYCLSSATDSESVRSTHRDAHGLLPSSIHEVVEGNEAAFAGDKPMFIDIHEMGAGKVTAKDVAGAHEKDLAVEGKYGVNFVNYWVDEKEGKIMCLSQAPDSNAVKKTHKEAHGLMPVQVLMVKQGQ